MRKKSLGRIAAFAVVATVGGLLPFFAAASASAAAPTTLVVAPPSTKTVAQGDTAVYSVGFNNTVAPGGIYYAIGSGPDGASAPFSAALPCTVNLAGTAADCSVTNTSSVAGTDNLTFFWSPTSAPTAQFVASDPTASGKLIVTGPVNAITASPATTHVAQGQWATYKVTATDADGNPLPGQGIHISAAQANQAAATLQLSDTAPVEPAFTGTDPPSGIAQTATLNVTTGSTGAANFYANSTVAGTVSFTFTANPPVAGVQGTATLTVDPGTANDVTQVLVTPATQTAFQNAPVDETVQVENAQGDLVGDPAAMPLISITAGPNSGRTPNPVSVTQTAAAMRGTYTATYTTLPASTTTTTTGTDTLRAFVNHTPGTAGLDAGEPSKTATITVIARPAGIHLVRISPNPVNASTNSTTAPVIFEVENGNNAPLSGFGVTLAIDTAGSTPPSQRPGYSVSPPLATSGSDGRFVATVTDADPLVGDVVAIKATLVGDITQTITTSVDFNAPSDVVAIQPYVSTGKVGGSASFTATTADPHGVPVAGVNYIWTVFNGTTVVNGVGATFSYTDMGSTTTDHQDSVSVSSFQNGVQLGSDTTTQYWVRDGVAAQANITLSNFGGGYTGQGVNQLTPPFTPHGFVNTLTTSPIADPTPTNPTTGVVPVGAMLADGNNNRLFGKSVTFASSGVGAFVDENGNALPGNSITARVDDNGGFVTENGQPSSDPDVPGFASVFVRSSVAGTQTITATADGVSSVGTITWSGQYVPLTPFRVFDTRTGQGGAGTTPLAPDTLTYFDYSETALTLGASAYVFNVTAIGAKKVGNLRVADECIGNSATRSSTVPDTSLINYQPGKDVANAIVVPSDCGGLRVYSAGAAVNVAIDVEGYYAGSNAFRNTAPTRIADTRTGVGTGGASSIAGGSHLSIQVTGMAGIPDGAKAVAVNLTAIDPSGQGNLRVYPDGAAVPGTSSVNYIPHVDKAAFAVVNVPADGKINIYSAGATIGLAVDVFGYYPSSSNVVTSAPVRVFDSRSTGSLSANHAMSFQVSGLAGVPDDAQAVLVSVTSIHNAHSTGVGNLRIFPAGSPVPAASTLNYVSSTSDVANFAIVKLGTNGQLSLYSAGSPIDAAVDVLGYVPAGS